MKITDYNDEATRQSLLAEARQKEVEDSRAQLQGKPRSPLLDGVSID